MISILLATLFILASASSTATDRAALQRIGEIINSKTGRTCNIGDITGCNSGSPCKSQECPNMLFEVDDSKRIIGLNISYVNLLTIPTEIGLLDMLSALLLIGNALTALPTEVSTLTRLSYVCITRTFSHSTLGYLTRGSTLTILPHFHRNCCLYRACCL